MTNQPQLCASNDTAQQSPPLRRGTGRFSAHMRRDQRGGGGACALSGQGDAGLRPRSVRSVVPAVYRPEEPSPAGAQPGRPRRARSAAVGLLGSSAARALSKKDPVRFVLPRCEGCAGALRKGLRIGSFSDTEGVGAIRQVRAASAPRVLTQLLERGEASPS